MRVEVVRSKYEVSTNFICVSITHRFLGTALFTTITESRLWFSWLGVGLFALTALIGGDITYTVQR
jgi:hypothetical protein